MGKNGFVNLIILIVMAVLFIAVGSLGAVRFFKNYNESNQIVHKEIKNPSSNLTVKEAIGAFNESFVHYLLYSIKAYNLHSSPLSHDKPKIEFKIEGDTYNAIVDKGNILVSKGAIDRKDVLFRTTKKEAVKMMKDKNYISESFRSGNSSIELFAGKTELALKGYLSIYTELTGKGITGFVFKNF